MELKLIDNNGQAGATVSVSDALFGREYNQDLVHQLVTAFLANARSSNSKQKGRAEINKSTHKPFAQKGTGRARAGRASSPLWRGGGKIFPNTGLENYEQKVNRKMYRVGMATIWSKLAADGRLLVVDDMKVDSPKTKQFVQKIASMGLNEPRVLIVADEIDENLYLSSRNVANVLVLEPHQADPYTLVGSSKVVVTKGAMSKIEEMFA